MSCCEPKPTPAPCCEAAARLQEAGVDGPCCDPTTGEARAPDGTPSGPCCAPASPKRRAP